MSLRRAGRRIGNRLGKRVDRKLPREQARQQQVAGAAEVLDLLAQCGDFRMQWLEVIGGSLNQ